MFTLFKSSFQKYVDFNGRATRKEFWNFVFFYYLSAIIGGLVDGIMGTDFVGNIIVAGLTLPYVSCAARRMHDVGKSGWFMLIPFYNLILALTPSTPEKTES
jgi:uncharacterized membrane protein YhaH (DUF805 family)